MSDSKPRSLRQADTMYRQTMESPVGRLTICSSAASICGISFFAVPNVPPISVAGPIGIRKVLARAAEQLEHYFAGDLREFDLPLMTAGSQFRELVWAQLQQIPFGVVTSYGEIARRIGKPAAARAVGQAIHHNPVAIVIPCHRVIGADRSLTGFGGGLERKRYLLDLERVTFNG